MILRKHIQIVTIIVLTYCGSVVSFFEPFSYTGVIVVGLFGTASKFIYDKTYCKIHECCSEEYIPANFDKLEILLNKNVYGQHLVQEVLINALKSHWNSPHAQKALTLSFHGWPGGGKNYVSKFIKESIYTKGSLSNYVHHFMGRVHFPLQEKANEYKLQLYDWIKGNVTICPKQLFIFDEVDKMPATVLNAIKPMIDYNENVEKVDYRKCIFIFLSNTGGSIITNQMLKIWDDGVQRNDIKLHDFEKLILQGAFNEEGWLYKEDFINTIVRNLLIYTDLVGAYQQILRFGGFHHADPIKSNLIDHYIPFLPLEMKHVRLCILHEFSIRGIINPEEKYVKDVLDFVEWGPSPKNLFSKTGCKRLSQKVAMVVQKIKFNKIMN